MSVPFCILSQGCAGKYSGRMSHIPAGEKDAIPASIHGLFIDPGVSHELSIREI